jgi:Uma2 family endonuclease
VQELTTETQSSKLPFLTDAEESSESGRPYLWTREEYYRLAETGFFEGKQVELLEGEIFEMSPMKTPHATAIRLIVELMRKIFTDGFVVDSQMPLGFSQKSEPEPDIAVVKGEIRDFVESHPASAELLIEVSDTTLLYDRNRKGSLYAKNNIQDYWIINLKDRRLEIYRRPMTDRETFYGFGFGEIQILREGDTVSPLVKPEVEIKVSDLLP